MVNRTCLGCGKEFYVKASRVAKGCGKFCSQKCAWANKATGELAANWKGRPPRKYDAQKQKEYVARQHDAIFAVLGHECVRCGFSDKRALQVDHINGGGGKRRKEIGQSWKQILADILQNPSGFQILCANCNWIKRHENQEFRKRNEVNVDNCHNC